MRMDATSGPSAADLLATASEGELIRILRTYGEEKFAPRIARLIIDVGTKRRLRAPENSSTLFVRLFPRRPGARAVTPPSARSRRCAWP